LVKLYERYQPCGRANTEVVKRERVKDKLALQGRKKGMKTMQAALISNSPREEKRGIRRRCLCTKKTK